MSGVFTTTGTMRSFTTPRVVISRCIEFDRCRYNGQMISSPIVRSLKDHVTFYTVCPEADIGLGVPRHRIRLISTDGYIHLVQPATQSDITDRMRSFIDSFIKSLPDIDGFILKSRSPSCGTRDVPIYQSSNPSAVIDKRGGLFGEVILTRFPYLAIEEEGRLKNVRIREHFLTKLFALSHFRNVRAAESTELLKEFHVEHSLLLRAYDKEVTEEMARLLETDTAEPGTLLARYEQLLHSALVHPPSIESLVSALDEVVEGLGDRLTAEEKDLYLDAIRQYREGKATRCPAIVLIRAWIARFGDPALIRQSLFTPYPEDLKEIPEAESDLGRDLWHASQE
jgi:uncharacterized protein YbbK (DUF523 family)/uncharacterized protein YbgA (DUF1722 family)